MIRNAYFALDDSNVGFSPICLYHLSRGIYSQQKQRVSGEITVKSGQLFTARTANFITVFLTASIGVCFLILPSIEMFRATVYGGFVFKKHQLAAEPQLFWLLLFFHLIVALLPITAGALLLLFPPRKIQSIENKLNTPTEIG